jgi:hypothetical protein
MAQRQESAAAPGNNCPDCTWSQQHKQLINTSRPQGNLRPSHASVVASYDLRTAALLLPHQAPLPSSQLLQPEDPAVWQALQCVHPAAYLDKLGSICRGLKVRHGLRGTAIPLCGLRW